MHAYSHSSSRKIIIPSSVSHENKLAQWDIFGTPIQDLQGMSFKQGRCKKLGNEYVKKNDSFFMTILLVKIGIDAICK